MIKLHDVIFKQSETCPHQVCLQIFEQNKWNKLTFEEVKEDVRKKASLLKEMGVQSGDRVVLLAENKPDTMIAFLAILQADATAVFLDPALPMAELKKMLARLDASVLLVSSSYLDRIDSSLSTSLVVRCLQNAFSVIEGYRSHHPHRLPNKSSNRDEAVIVFTSGTTGHSNGVILTHANLTTSAQLAKYTLNLTKEDRMLSVLPIHHISPLTQNLAGIYWGITTTYLEKLDAATMLHAMQATRTTMTGVVPLLLDVFLKKIQEEITKKNKVTQSLIRLFSSISKVVRQKTSWNIGFYLFNKIQKTFGGKLTRFVCGGAPANPSVLKQLEIYGFTIFEGYGMTETTGPTCFNRLQAKRIGTVGKMLPGMDIRIESIPGEKEGEICIKGPLLMKEYFSDPEATKKMIRDSWLYTGDLGYVDKDGFLIVTGRIREMIVLSSGKKAIPMDVEEHYKDIEGIAELAVFGMKENDQVGEQVYAAVVLNDKSDNANKDLKQNIKDKIYKRASQLAVPFQIQRLFFVETLPKTTTLKVKRTLLQTWVRDKIIEPYLSIEATTNESESVSYENTSFLHRQLHNVTKEERDSLIRYMLRNYVSFLLGIHPQELQDHTDFYELGMNSLLALQLKSFLDENIGPEVMSSNATIYEYRNIKSLTAYIDNQWNSADCVNSNKKAPLSLTEEDKKKIECHMQKLLYPALHVKLAKWLIRSIIFCGTKLLFKIKVYGEENLPKEESYIICANHSSHLDGVALSYATRKWLKNNFMALTAEDYFHKAKIITLLGDLIPFDRTGNEYAFYKGLQYIKLGQKANRVLVLFPEGTRSLDGQLQEFKPGLAWFAAHSKLKIIPTYIGDVHQLLPPGKMLPKPGKISVSFGKPIHFPVDVAALGNDAVKCYHEFTQCVRSAILELNPRISNS